MADIAAKTGVSRVAVSLALRNHPRISAPLRREVKRVARELGFVPDPLLSALAVHQQHRVQPASHGALAWINRWNDPKQLRQFREFDLYWKGAYKAAANHGFRLDEIRWEPDCSANRLEKILLTRGIEGMLIPPHRELIDWGDFDWKKFSIVRFGLSVPTPDSNTVTADIYRATVMALGRMHEYGYRRIGITVNREFNDRIGGGLTSGFFHAQRKYGLEPVPPLLTFLKSRTAEELSRQEAALDLWLKRYKPDALLICDIEVSGMLRKLGYRIPEDIAVAGTSVLDIPGVDAGIDQHAEAIGRAAVETLLKQMNIGERGIPRHPIRILIKSHWRDGDSLPPIGNGMVEDRALSVTERTSLVTATGRRVSLKEIADKVGVSKNTVSLALRQSPRISSTLRKQICGIANELGYKADPVLLRLSEYRRTNSSAGFQNVIAWLNHWNESDKLRSYHEFNQYWCGAKQSATQLGYQLEEFVWPSDCPANHIEQRLRDRGVMGLLIPPHKPDADWAHFNWSQFSLIRFGFSVREVDANLVTADHLRATVMAISRIRQYGYRRIGLVYDRPHDHYLGGNYLGGYTWAHELLGREQLIPPLNCQAGTPEILDRSRRGLEAWMKKHKPDAILTPNPEVPLLLKELGYRIPDDVAVAGTSPYDMTVDAGIDQCPFSIGQIAAEMLIKQISLNEFGEPADPCRILVESLWRDGESLPAT
jgi:DNA-binding LacI/PurR family transcriptional regulator